MNTQPDFEDFLRLLETHRVDYMIVGGDLINQISGVAFSVARQNVVRGQYGHIVVTFIGREDLILNKNSTNRAKDKADVEELA